MSLFERSQKILIVEDEPDIAELLKSRLELEKYKVIVANDGNVGVRLARKEKPNLVIMDVMMPEVDGYDACKLLKNDAETKDIPILILTALPHVKDADKAFEVGANDFLNKPYTNERLMQKVHKLLPKE